MTKIICFFRGHKFNSEAPKLKLRFKGETNYERHNVCARCKRLIIV